MGSSSFLVEGHAILPLYSSPGWASWAIFADYCSALSSPVVLGLLDLHAGFSYRDEVKSHPAISHLTRNSSEEDLSQRPLCGRMGFRFRIVLIGLRTGDSSARAGAQRRSALRMGQH
jgi:hypothetical protein